MEPAEGTAHVLTHTLPPVRSCKPGNRNSLLPSQFLQLLPQPAESPNQASKIDAMDHPSGNIGGEENLMPFIAGSDRTEGWPWPPLPPPPAIPWREPLRSSRCSSSRRNRDQHTRKAKHKKRHPTNQQHVQHARIHRPTAANHRLRMLGAEEPDRKVDQRHVQRAKDRQGCSQHLRLRAVEKRRSTR